MPIESVRDIEDSISWARPSNVARPTRSGSVWQIRALLRSPDSDRQIKKMIPARSSVHIKTGLTITVSSQRHFALLCSYPDLVERDIWIAGGPIVIPAGFGMIIEPRLFNAHFETAWIEDGQIIANLLVMP